MGEEAIPELSKDERLELLSKRPILRGLPLAMLEELDASLEERKLMGGVRAVRRGQTDVPFILVVQGGLRASFLDDEGHRHGLIEYFRGATVGEALVLSGEPSPVDLDAIRDSQLLCLPREGFQSLASRYPELALLFARVVTGNLVHLLGSPEFLGSLSRNVDRLPRSIALVGLGGERARRTSELVASALSRSRNTVLLRHGDAHLMASKVGLRERLDRIRASAELVVLQCDPPDSPWSDQCLRQADRIMVLVDDDCPLERTTAWWYGAKLAEELAHVELAVVHDRSAELPRSGDAYAHLPGVARLHHVRRDDPAHADRLARWLLDRPVGLVLGGGGARGIAHVGILKALEEENVPIDVVGGTSMGAIFAGGLARGWSADRQMEEVRRLFASRFALYDPTIPRTSLFAGKKLERVLRSFFGEISIADLWIRFLCIATNISRPGPRVLDSGGLCDAIRSSCSIPGVFPPFHAGEDLLIDGGLVDNLPIDEVRQRCRGPLIAADVSGSQRIKGQERSPGDPRLVEILVRASFVGSQHTTEAALATRPPTLYLLPELQGFRMLDWSSYEAIFEAGYTHAKRGIESGALPRSLWEGHLADTPS